MRAAEVAPVSLGMIGVESHGLPDPFDAVLGPPKPCQKLAVLNQNKIVVRVEAQRALLMIAGLLVVMARQVHRREDPVNIAVVVVEAERDLKLVRNLVPGAF